MYRIVYRKLNCSALPACRVAPSPLTSAVALPTREHGRPFKPAVLASRRHPGTRTGTRVAHLDRQAKVYLRELRVRPGAAGERADPRQTDEAYDSASSTRLRLLPAGQLVSKLSSYAPCPAQPLLEPYAIQDELVSRAFSGRAGPAFLMRSA